MAEINPVTAPQPQPIIDRVIDTVHTGLIAAGIAIVGITGAFFTAIDVAAQMFGRETLFRAPQEAGIVIQADQVLAGTALIGLLSGHYIDGLMLGQTL